MMKYHIITVLLISVGCISASDATPQDDSSTPIPPHYSPVKACIFEQINEAVPLNKDCAILVTDYLCLDSATMSTSTKRVYAWKDVLNFYSRLFPNNVDRKLAKQFLLSFPIVEVLKNQQESEDNEANFAYCRSLLNNTDTLREWFGEDFVPSNENIENITLATYFSGMLPHLLIVADKSRVRFHDVYPLKKHIIP